MKITQLFKMTHQQPNGTILLMETLLIGQWKHVTQPHQRELVCHQSMLIWRTPIIILTGQRKIAWKISAIGIGIRSHNVVLYHTMLQLKSTMVKIKQGQTHLIIIKFTWYSSKLIHVLKIHLLSSLMDSGGPNHSSNHIQEIYNGKLTILDFTTELNILLTMVQ